MLAIAAIATFISRRARSGNAFVCAEALDLQATGIGAFYDLVHEYLDLGSEQRQVVYHFACGYAVEDRRLVPTIDDVSCEQ